MESIDTHGKTVEEAIQKALEQLGVTRDEVDISIIKEGKHGILGMGSEDAVVQVQLLTQPPSLNDDDGSDEDIAAVSSHILETLLNHMGVTATISVEEAPPQEEGAPGVINLNVSGDDLGILIGRRGQTLTSLQHIVRVIVAHQTKTRMPIVVDVEGYKQRRYEALQALALRVAEQVTAKGRQFALEPMLAYERRIIHLTLANNPEVITESIGEGDDRKVVIMPKRKPRF
jgi:spoIIIJ-associated protein